MVGVVDYANYDDMKRAVSSMLNVFVRFSFGAVSSDLLAIHLSLMQVRKLDDSEFRNAFSRAYIRVCLRSSDFSNLSLTVLL